MVIQNKYEIIKTIYENDFQRILECKEDNTENIFINNIIFNQSIINLIEEDKIKNAFNSEIDSYKTEDRLYLQTEPCKYSMLKDYVNNNELTLKQQFKLTEQIIELGNKVFDMTDLVQFSVMKYDNLCIDNNGDVCTKNIIIFDQEYDISENVTLKRISDIIHYIFSKQTINDYDISEKIPPDILKIVVRCLTKEYSTPNDALVDLYGSQIYKLVNPNTNINSAEYENEPEKSENNNEDIILEEAVMGLDDNDDISKEDLKVYDEYENEFIDYDDNDYNEDKFPMKKVIIPLVIIIVLVPLLFWGYKKIGNKSEQAGKFPSDTDNTTNSSIDVPSDDTDDSENSTSSAIDNKDTANIPDEIDKFLNEDLVKKTGFEGLIARKSTENFYEGDCSLLAENNNEENGKILFAVFDIEDEEYSYLKNRQIGISVNLKAKKNVEAMLVIETFTSGKISANSSDKVEIYNDIWTIKQTVIDVGNIDRIDAYIEYAGKNKVWIDNIEIDILK